jgi:hypothetical protein
MQYDKTYMNFMSVGVSMRTVNLGDPQEPPTIKDHMKSNFKKYVSCNKDNIIAVTGVIAGILFAWVVGTLIKVLLPPP